MDLVPYTGKENTQERPLGITRLGLLHHSGYVKAFRIGLGLVPHKHLGKTFRVNWAWAASPLWICRGISYRVGPGPNIQVGKTLRREL